MVEQCVVDNRVFLLGLDGLYRHAMKRHERTELLICARRVAATLRVTLANVPVEGYYSEEEELTEYFCIMRALQQVEGSRASEVARMKEFERLRNVTSAPLYGRPVDEGKLLPVGRDALSQALLETFPEWTVARLTVAAYEIAQKTDDISLVGLAARIRDPVVLAAVRESVVLYAEAMLKAGYQHRRSMCGRLRTIWSIWPVGSSMLSTPSLARNCHVRNPRSPSVTGKRTKTMRFLADAFGLVTMTACRLYGTITGVSVAAPPASWRCA